jgi:propanol-preferring alcohol dehydrogenase
LLQIARALTIIGVLVGDRKDAIEVMQLAERGIVETRLIKAKMEDLTEIFQKMEDGLLIGKVVLELSPDSSMDSCRTPVMHD